MAGPGFQDFEYQEEYAPIYRYLVPSNGRSSAAASIDLSYVRHRTRF